MLSSKATSLCEKKKKQESGSRCKSLAWSLLLFYHEVGSDTPKAAALRPQRKTRQYEVLHKGQQELPSSGRDQEVARWYVSPSQIVTPNEEPWERANLSKAFH